MNEIHYFPSMTCCDSWKVTVLNMVWSPNYAVLSTFVYPLLCFSYATSNGSSRWQYDIIKNLGSPIYIINISQELLNNSRFCPFNVSVSDRQWIATKVTWYIVTTVDRLNHYIVTILATLLTVSLSMSRTFIPGPLFSIILEIYCLTASVTFILTTFWNSSNDILKNTQRPNSMN